MYRALADADRDNKFTRDEFVVVSVMEIDGK
jgi:hypothetical protein